MKDVKQVAKWGCISLSELTISASDLRGSTTSILITRHRTGVDVPRVCTAPAERTMLYFGRAPLTGIFQT